MSRLTLLATLAATFVATLGSAAPFTPHFDALRTHLESRLAGGTLDERQTKAAEKVLALLNKPSTSLVTDVRLATKVLKKLKTPFAAALLGASELATLVDTLIGALTGDVAAQFSTLEGTVNGLADGACKTKVQSFVDKAAAALESTISVPDPTKALTKALASITKGTAKAGKCEPGGGGGTCDGTNTLSVSVDGSPFVPKTAFFHRGEDVQSVVVNGSANAPAFSEISVVAWNVTGTGTFPIQEFSSWVENGDVTYQPPSWYSVTGNLTVTKLVTGPAPCVAGSFDVTFTGGPSPRHITGTYDLSHTTP